MFISFSYSSPLVLTVALHSFDLISAVLQTTVPQICSPQLQKTQAFRWEIVNSIALLFSLLFVLFVSVFTVKIYETYCVMQGIKSKEYSLQPSLPVFGMNVAISNSETATLTNFSWFHINTVVLCFSEHCNKSLFSVDSS